MTHPDGDEYAEQVRAWEAEEKRLAERGPGARFSDALQAFAERWRTPVLLAFFAAAITVLIGAISLLGAWLTH